jgi:tryptophanyl-tRNA synthetase
MAEFGGPTLREVQRRMGLAVKDMDEAAKHFQMIEVACRDVTTNLVGVINLGFDPEDSITTMADTVQELKELSFELKQRFAALRQGLRSYYN